MTFDVERASLENVVFDECRPFQCGVLGMSTTEQFVKLVTTALKSADINNGETRVEVERVLGALKQLESFEVTSQLLSETKGGKQVKRLYKSRILGISDAAKNVIQVWKARIIDEERQTTREFSKRAFSKSSLERTPSEALSSDRASPKRSDAPATGNSTTEGGSMSRGDVSSSSLTPVSTLARKNSVNSVGMAKTGNRAREVARTKFAQILESEASRMRDIVVNSTTAGIEIEKAIYDQKGEPNRDEYRNKFRTLQFNLKDPKNGALRQRVLRREISAERLVNLSTEELANEEKKRQNEDIRKSKLRECERGLQQGGTTDAFTCGKCKATECTYYQMQTRSADEPMTTYVTCSKCGNRWKF